MDLPNLNVSDSASGLFKSMKAKFGLHSHKGKGEQSSGGADVPGARTGSKDNAPGADHNSSMFKDFPGTRLAMSSAFRGASSTCGVGSLVWGGLKEGGQLVATRITLALGMCPRVFWTIK